LRAGAQIADRLKKLGISEGAPRFAENYVDAGVPRDLTDEDLKDPGVVLGVFAQLVCVPTLA
jgi:hypothetical protein